MQPGRCCPATLTFKLAAGAASAVVPRAERAGQLPHPTLIAQKWRLARRISPSDFLVGTQRIIVHKDHLVGVQIIELDGPDNISVQILDTHIDAAVLEAKLVRLLTCPERSMTASP